MSTYTNREITERVDSLIEDLEACLSYLMMTKNILSLGEPDMVMGEKGDYLDVTVREAERTVKGFK